MNRLKHVSLLTILAIGLGGSLAYAQEKAGPTLTFEDYMGIVEEHHPFSTAADLQIDQAEALLQRSRGGFDPKVYGSFGQKDLKDTRYYDLVNAGLAVPTWLGATFYADYSQNDGTYLNPQLTTPDNGLLSAGVSLSVGRGLFIDERRAELRRAQLSLEMADSGRRLAQNELLFEAGYAYWEWFYAYHVARTLESSLGLVTQRFQDTKAAASLGDRPSIDTLESSIQVQNRNLQLQQALLDERNAAAEMSIYLWLEGLVPMEVGNGTRPVALDTTGLRLADEEMIRSLDSLRINHPKIVMSELGLDQIEIERRWKQEQLKPQVDLKYNFLSEAVSATEGGGINANDYTFGVTFGMPVLLRKERGSLAMTDIKLQEGALKLSDTRQNIWLKARQSVNDLDISARQIRDYARTVIDYGNLLDGERELFLSGESSVFLVNRRELGLLGAQIKMIELITKNHEAELKVDYAFARLPLN